MIVASVFLFLGFVIVIMNPFIVLIHELGHATPALIFTKNADIEIYVGSYGDKKNTLKFRIGRLLFFIKYSYNFFRIRGLCSLNEQLPTSNKKLIFIFGGPVINLITGLLMFYFTYNFADDGAFKVISTIFICYSFFMFFGNLVPRTFRSKEGEMLKSDGKQIHILFQHKKLIKHAQKGDAFLNQKLYILALKQYKKCIKLGLKASDISTALATIYIQLKKYHEVEQVILPKIENNTADVNDFYFIAYASIMKNDFEKAISFARKALEIDNNNQPTLNLLGYCLIETNNLVEAENVLLKALDDEQSKSYALNNLGYIKIIQDKLEEGLLLIEESLQLNTTNGYTYSNRGIYHYKKEQFALAKIDFEKGNEIEKDVLHLDEWMQKLQCKI